ncbi:uncharacterized protein [Apostichopus japonicus]|uniref:uncharacterized protein n=1 Tax=Stichopus japonicus TaxID=307972 RepID=UPI003AB2FA0E
MGPQNVVASFAKACTLYSTRTFTTSYILSLKSCRKRQRQLLQRNVASRYSTSCRLLNEKKVGLFLFGRPPEPNLDAGKQSVEEGIENLDPFSREILEKLHNAISPTVILNICKDNKQFMTDIHTSRALQQLAQVWELNPENLPAEISERKELQTAEPMFRELCVSCLRDAQHMDDFTFLSSLRSLIKIGVPENSALVHTLLEHSKHRLNEMSSATFAMFCQIVSRLKVDSEMSQALRKAVILIVPKMIVKADAVWQCVTYLETAWKDISWSDRSRLLNKLIALLKLDPSVTVEDCCQVVEALNSLKVQSGETVEAVCEHVGEHHRNLSAIDVCRLIKGLGRFRYLNLDTMRHLVDRVSHSFQELDSYSLCNVFNGLSNGRYHHADLANLGCRYVVESISDEDLMVEISLVAATSRYFTRLNLKPDQLDEFLELSHKECEVFFSQRAAGATMQEKVDALDASYHLSILNNLKPPLTRPRFEAKAREYLQAGNLWTANVQKILLQIATLRCMDGTFDSDPTIDGNDQLTQPLPNPWKITQRHDHSFESKLVLDLLEDSGRSCRWNSEVDLGGGLTADFVVMSSSTNLKPTNKGLALNILHQEGQAANQKGHLVGLYYLKDKLMKSLGYQTLWIESSYLSKNQPEGKELRDGALIYLNELLQKNGVNLHHHE